MHRLCFGGYVQSVCLRLAFPLLLLLAGTLPASATLGEDVSSINSDQAQMRASAQVSSRELYSIHEMQTAAGTDVKQFVSPAGTVFAVSWQGTAPDLKQLLGNYFDEFVSSSKPAARGRGIRIDHGDLVIETGGHMRYVVGRAYLRSKLPQGVTTDDIR